MATQNSTGENEFSNVHTHDFHCSKIRQFLSMFEFWEEVASIVATLVFVHVASPTLVELGIFHFCMDMLLEVLFLYITYQRKGWFDKIYYGLFDKDAIKVGLSY